ncbi:MAG TPA: Swt1 family HEPN domain-containing protein, partial [Actinotalea sp.]|nr:Swt1 family HEPN domain-containing protein [Actinotalea sp.]
MTLTPRERVGRGLDILAAGLRPFVDLHMSASTPGKDWVALLQARDEQRDGRPRVYSADDPQVVLRVLTEEWRTFGPDLTRVMRAMAQELRETRNQWAHGPSMSGDDAARALDTMERLLSAANAAGAAHAIRDLRAATSAPSAVQDTPAPQGQDAVQDAPALPARDTSAEPGPVLRPRPRPPLPRGHSRVTIESGPLDVDLVFSDAVNYALVHNGVSPLVALTVSNLGDGPITLGSLTITLESPLAEALTDPLLLADVTIAPGETHEAPTAALRLTLHPLPFARLAEATTGEVHLTATTAHGRHRAEHPIRILARDQWWSTSIPESLAAFVQPRDRAVADLLSEASDLLAARTGDPSLQGYQAGYERVLAITEAVYDAMRGRRIRYIEPPASFEGMGQKIRPPREVLVDRWGTCLDLTCTLAAAFEAAGLNPVIVSCVGHAFAGVLLEDSQLAEVAVGERNHIVNLAESGLLVALETTALTASAESRSFDQARAATRPWFTQHLDKIQYALDVRTAHRRVRPLPVVTEGEGGVVVVEVERPAEAPPRAPREPARTAADDAAPHP